MAYSTLNTDQNLIRLLRLSPTSSQDDVIRCQFTVALLDDKPNYEALSYVWGDVNDTRSIEVKGIAVSITSNLYSALKDLQVEDKERTIWVDALCINQADVKERMHQVSRMSSIYGQASQVIVWLGNGWDGSEMAMDFLRKLGEDGTLHLNPLLEPSICVDGLNLDSPELRRQLIHLFDLPWWKRTWTVQEFVLAQKLIFQCSKSSITRETMYLARENFWAHKDRCCPQNELDYHDPELRLSVSGSFLQPARLDYITKSRGSSYSVLSAIATFSRREVTDPRDRVYGILGLGTGEYTDLVQPDYTLSAEQVCEAVAIKSVERTGTLEFLSHTFEHQNSKLPSFIPDWTGNFSWNDIYENRLGHLNWFNASLNTPADLKFISHELVATRGVIFDVVTSTSSQPLRQIDSYLKSLDELHGIAGLNGLSEEVYGFTTDSRLVAFWHSLCGGMEMFLQHSNRYSRRLKGSTDLSKYSKWKNFCTANHQERAELWDNEMPHIWLDIETATYCRRFFNTKKGYFGFGPQKCEVGDVVVVLAGGNVPYLIRPVPYLTKLRRIFRYLTQSWNFLGRVRAAAKLHSERCYTFVGDSYTHGIMDGEAFEHGEESQRELREIVLM